MYETESQEFTNLWKRLVESCTLLNHAHRCQSHHPQMYLSRLQHIPVSVGLMDLFIHFVKKKNSWTYSVTKECRDATEYRAAVYLELGFARLLR